MANKSLEIMDLKQLLQLKASGKSNRKIGEILGRSRNTINDYVALFLQSSQSLEVLSKLDLSDLHKLLINLKAEQDPKPDQQRFKELEALKETYLNDLKRPGAWLQSSLS